MAQNDGKQTPRPLLRNNRPKYKKLTCQIRVETHAKLLKYVAFFQKCESEKTDEGEMVDDALVQAFERDDAFKEFLKNGTVRGAGVSHQAPTVNVGEKGGDS